MTATLYLPTGPPGCGKSHLADKLVSRRLLDPDAIVSPDNTRHLLTGDRADQSANGVVFDICHAIALARLGHGLDVWFDATNLPRPELLIAKARALGAEVVIIRFDLHPRELRQRNQGREHPVPPEVLSRFIDLHREAFPEPVCR